MDRLSSVTWPIVTYHTSEILDEESALEYFTKSFLSITDKHAPFKKLRLKNRSSSWFTPELESVFQERDNTWTLARHSGEAAHWQIFRQLRNKCTSSLRKTKNNYHIELIANSGTDPSKFWKAVNINKNKSFSSTPSSVTFNDCLIDTPSEICHAFNTHFSAAGNPLVMVNSGFPPNNDHLDHVPPSDRTPQFSLKTLTSSVIKEALQTIDSRRAAGEDKLDPYFVKLCAPLISDQ